MVAALSVAGLSLAACGGGGGAAPAPRAAAVSNGTTAQIGSGVTGTLTLTVANGTGASAKNRSLKFVSPGALSAGISINNGTVTFADVSASSTLCTTAAGVRTCTINVGAPAGMTSFAVSLYDAATGGGHLLGSGSNSTTVVSGTPFTVAIGINPVVAGLMTNANISFTLGTPGSQTVTPQFLDPAGQIITGSGNVPNFLNTIGITFSDPHITATPSSLTTPGQSITFSYDGSALVASNVTSTITSNGVPVFTNHITIPGLLAIRYNLGPINGGGIAPQQITVGPDNKIWWAEQQTNLIGRIDPAIGASSITHFPTGFATGSAKGIAKGGDGNIWYSNGGRIIARMTTSGAAPATGPAQITVGLTGSQVTYLAPDSQGNVWYLNAGAGFSQVAYVDMSTFLPITFGSTPTPNGVNFASQLALGSDKAMWFTEPDTTPHSIVGRITTPANGTAGTYVESGINGTNGTTIFPFDLASGPDGNIWLSVFASTATNQFYAYFAPAATISGIFVFPNIIDPNAFANLVTMTAGPDGNMWIAEGGGAVKIPPASPTAAVTEFFTDNGQTTMNKCVAGPASDGKLWCTAVGSAPLGQGFIATADSIVTWVPR